MRLFRRRDENSRPYGPFYAAWYDLDRVRHEKSTRAYDEKAAQIIAREWERDAADPDHATANKATLSDALNVMLAERSSLVKVGKRSKDTLTFYRVKAGHLVRLFEHVDGTHKPFLLKTLRPRHVDEYVENRRHEGASEHTVAKEITTFRAALKLAKRRGLWRGDLDAMIPKGFSTEYKPRERHLPMPEVQRLLRELPSERAAVVAFIVATSAEWGVVERAERADISEDEKFVLLRGTKRATRLRTVPILTAEQRELLRFAIEHRGSEGTLMFIPWRNVRRDLPLACEQAGCRTTGCLDNPDRITPCTRADCRAAALKPCSPNDLRRSFAHQMLAHGLPNEIVAPMMGHADTRMLERVYGRRSAEELATRARAILAITSPASTPNTPTKHSSAGPADCMESAPLPGIPGLTESAELPVTTQSSVPTDGTDSPTRGFSIPVSNVSNTA